MTTEVKHGATPHWAATLTGGHFTCVIEGHYTTIPDLAAAGVTVEQWASARDAKRLAELLALRTAFVNWFLDRYVDFGGTLEGAVSQIAHVCRVELDTRAKE